MSISNFKPHTANSRPVAAQRLRVLGGLHVRVPEQTLGPQRGLPLHLSYAFTWSVGFISCGIFLFVIFVFQSGTLKEPDSSKTPPQRPPPQGCLQYILDCNGIAVGPKQVQAS